MPTRGKLTVIALSALLAACDLGPRDPGTVMYVRVPSPKAPAFTTILASMLKDEGLNASIGRTTEPEPRTGYVLDAKNLNVRVRAENAVLGPTESRACGYPSEVSWEQTQYVVSIQRRSPFAATRTRELFTELRSKLVQRGFTVAARQMPCKQLTT